MFLPSKQQQMENPRQALRTARILWAALCMGVVITAALLISMKEPAAEPIDAPTHIDRMFFYIACAAALVGVVSGLVVRHLIFRFARSDGVVSPQAYVGGNLIAWAACEGAATVGILLAFIDRTLMPTILPATAAFAVMLLLFPNGRAMFTAPPDVQTDRYRDA